MAGAARLTERADVAIVGAGLFGCAAAYFLARAGRDVVVIDRGDIGAEASGANAGNLHLQISPFSHASESASWLAEFATMLPFFREGIALWKRLGDELATDLEMRFPGGLMVAETATQMDILREKVALERSQGLPVELIGPADLKAIAPYLSAHLLGASHCPDEGMANALTAVVAFADGARKAGARFALHDAVTALREDDDEWRVATERGELCARDVLIAAGSFSANVAAMTGIALPLTHREIQLVATEACTRFVEHLVYHTSERLTLKQVGNGNVIVGGGWQASVDPVFGRPAVLSESLRGSLTLAQRVVPRLAGVHLLRSWAGRNAYTPDGRPILGPVPGRRGVHLAICNTYGFTLGPLCALIAAETLLDRSPTFPLDRFSLARFGDA
jgi:glycine/D-amino acid oxidase-like deaminating enzyme